MNDTNQSQTAIPTKRRCTVTVSSRAWHGSKAAAHAVGCGSISELLEKLGNGELAVVVADEVGPPLQDEGPLFQNEPGGFTQNGSTARAVTAWPLDAMGDDSPSANTAKPAIKSRQVSGLRSLFSRIPKVVLTAASASLILFPILYVLDMRLSGPQTKPATIDVDQAITLTTGDTVAGYEVTDHMRIRPVHPVTGATNVPHNGVDLATPSGTPVYAVGVTDDEVTVDCWWDVDGGGWVADQTTESYPQLVFQSLHLLENECRSGTFTSGEVIALTGNSGLGSGEHYDFRVKLDGRYIDPPKQLVEAAITGKTLTSDGQLVK
ncbi:MAG: peptidoglycan DD-metalloendopeptidase family protein [Cyanobacteria bacterium P01_F01_bin.116]